MIGGSDYGQYRLVMTVILHANFRTFSLMLWPSNFLVSQLSVPWGLR